MEGEQGHHVGEQREGEGQAEAGRQTPVPQDALDEGGHQVDVAWKGDDASGRMKASHGQEQRCCLNLSLAWK